jgi:hypothetical protein
LPLPVRPPAESGRIAFSGLSRRSGLSAFRTSVHGFRPDGQVDLAEACAWVVANIDPGKDSPSIARANAAEWLDILSHKYSRRLTRPRLPVP